MTLKACTVCGLPGAWGRGSRCPRHKTSSNLHSHPSRGSATYQSRRLEVFERDGYRCRWCSAELERERGDGGRPPELDHVVPRAAGGTDDLANLVAACRPCNRSRGKRPGAPRR